MHQLVLVPRPREEIAEAEAPFERRIDFKLFVITFFLFSRNTIGNDYIL